MSTSVGHRLPRCPTEVGHRPVVDPLEVQAPRRGRHARLGTRAPLEQLRDRLRRLEQRPDQRAHHVTQERVGGHGEVQLVATPFPSGGADLTPEDLVLRLGRGERREVVLADEQGPLWDGVANQPLAGIQEIRVPRRAQRAARIAGLEVRFAPVTLRPPRLKPHLGSLRLWAVLAEESQPPPSSEPVCWMLLTTCPVDSFQAACEKLRWYSLRWNIEVFHRTLKSGCQIEQRQLGSADRLEACLAIDLVVAWRIFHLAKLGRETPHVPCTVYFEESEWKALVAYITQNPRPPHQPPSLYQAMRMVASLGGFLGRKGDGEPGTQTLWLGLQSLDTMAAMWRLLTGPPRTHPPPVSSGPTYG